MLGILEKDIELPIKIFVQVKLRRRFPGDFPFDVSLLEVFFVAVASKLLQMSVLTWRNAPLESTT